MGGEGDAHRVNAHVRPLLSVLLGAHNCHHVGAVLWCIRDAVFCGAARAQQGKRRSCLPASRWAWVRSQEGSQRRRTRGRHAHDFPVTPRRDQSESMRVNCSIMVIERRVRLTLQNDAREGAVNSREHFPPALPAVCSSSSPAWPAASPAFWTASPVFWPP